MRRLAKKVARVTMPSKADDRLITTAEIVKERLCGHKSGSSL